MQRISPPDLASLGRVTVVYIYILNMAIGVAWNLASRQQRLCPSICILIEFLSCRSGLCCTKNGPIDVHARSNQQIFCSTIGQRLLPVLEAKKKYVPGVGDAAS